MKLAENLRARAALARRFQPEFAGQRVTLAVVFAASLGVALCQVAAPWPIQRIFDDVLAPRDAAAAAPWSAVWLWAGVLVGLTVAQAALEYAAALGVAKVGQHVARSLRLRLYRHLTQLSGRFFAQHKPGDLLVRLLGDVAMARAALVDATLELLTRSIWVSGVVLVMLWLDWTLTLALAAVLPAVAWVTRRGARKIETQARKQRRKEGALADFLQESLAAHELLQSLGAAPAFTRRLARESRTAERAGQKSARLAARMSGSVHALLGLGVALTIVFGAWRVLRSELTPGELLVFVSYVRGILKPVRSASRSGERIAKGVACARRIAEVLDTPVEICDAPDARDAALSPQALEFRGVHFRHAADREALAGLDARFERGQLSGVFGASGAGKSTLAALAVRLHDPERGAVCMGGDDLRALRLESVRARIGLCLQDAVLLGESVRANLELGRADASEAQLWSALESVGAADFVRELPQGLDTALGAQGVGLSGGQARRLALARTLLREPPILIVDEPFAGLDAVSAQRVLAALRSFARRGSAVIVIAHERELLEHYDQVVFLDAGRALDAGPHEALLARCAAYRRALVGDVAQAPSQRTNAADALECAP